jgi:hypothetical protein
MRLEPRQFGHRGQIKMLCLVCENDQESRLVDRYLGKQVMNDDGLIAEVQGEVRLSDGYGDHYIRLEKKK